MLKQSTVLTSVLQMTVHFLRVIQRMTVIWTSLLFRVTTTWKMAWKCSSAWQQNSWVRISYTHYMTAFFRPVWSGLFVRLSWDTKIIKQHNANSYSEAHRTRGNNGPILLWKDEGFFCLYLETRSTKSDQQLDSGPWTAEDKWSFDIKGTLRPKHVSIYSLSCC